MRVAIDARKLHDFGIGTYLRNLLKHLARLDRDTDYVLLCREADRPIGGRLGPNFRDIVERSPNYSIREQLHVPWVMRRERPDVYHAPHYVLPVLLPCRSVVTIHDCIHLRFPGDLPGIAARVYARAAMKAAVGRSSRILTVSEASRREILDFFDVSPGKIEVIYNAIDDLFWSSPTEAEVAGVRDRYRLDTAFVLYVGNVKPHKNLPRLIDAFGIVRRGGLDAMRLIVVGQDGSKPSVLDRAVHNGSPDDRVRFLGFVPDRTLAILYRLAAAFVCPSLHEGFGLPPLEAMASGTPVVTSNAPALVEVTGGAAQLVDPYDVGSIAAGLRSVLTDRELADRLRQKGLARAREFSWERSAARTREVYRMIGGAE
jgi:glycosyltransferase involved in cell wall biosynthesis